MKNASLVYALLLALVFPSLLVGQGTEKSAKETTTREERPFTAYNFPLEPGATLSITVTFNAATENGTFFRDKSDPSGKQFEAWPGCGNFDQVNPKSFRYTNPGTATIPFEFSAAYKVTPPNPNQPWYPSYGKVISYSEK